MDFFSFSFCLCYNPQPSYDEDDDDYGDIWRDSGESAVYDPYLSEKLRVGGEVEAAAVKRTKLFLGLEKEVEGEQPIGLMWQPSSIKDKIKVEESLVDGSIWQAVKAVTHINADKMDILDLLLDDNRTREYDEMFDFSELLVIVNEQTVIRRMCYKPVWPTAPRDFLCCITWVELEDGSILVCSRAVPNKFLKVKEDYVRGFVDITGYWIQPCDLLDKKDPSYMPPSSKPCCKVTLAVHTDLGGTLPTWIINMLITEAPVKVLTNIGRIFDGEKVEIMQ